MVPVGLGDGVAEPLVNGLVGDDLGAAGPIHGIVERPADERRRIEDRARVLHAAPPRGRLHVGELLVWIGTEQRVVEGDDLAGARERRDGRRRIGGIRPGGDRHPGGLAQRGDGEVGGPDHHRVGGDPGRLGPAGARPPVVEIDPLEERPVRHHLPSRGGDDVELDRRLVGRMVDRREPRVCPVGPVVREHRRVPRRRPTEDQPVRRSAVVVDHRLAAGPRIRPRRLQPKRSVRVARERDRDPVDRHAVDRHRGSEIEGEAGDPRLVGGLVEDRGPAPDRPPLGRKLEADLVVDHVDVRTPLVPVGDAVGDPGRGLLRVDPRGEKRRPRDRERRDPCPGRSPPHYSV